MVKFLSLFLLLFCCSAIAAQGRKAQAGNDRKLWLQYLDKVARPVLSSLAEGRLKEKMPVELPGNVDNKESRQQASYLEAVGRLLSGIGPWLNGEGGDVQEVALRNQYRAWALKGIARAVNPASPDYLKWTGGQPLVDASFFALGLIRCPWLWERSDTTVRRQIVTALLSSRSTVPVYSNWILFSGMIEAFFCRYGLEYDAVRIEYGIREFSEHWYKGDGVFSDGREFHFDYYNSYVIQPYLANILAALQYRKKDAYGWFAPRLAAITKRYAEILERLIHTDGSFPVTGRSITYRGGAFHHLADLALRKGLPPSLPPAQVRSALTAVLRKTLEPPSTFTGDGWLRIGLSGAQPGLAERYINTGSLYLCASLFLPLGLSPEDPFWSGPALPWTSVKAWSGADLPADHALEPEH